MGAFGGVAGEVPGLVVASHVFAGEGENALMLVALAWLLSVGAGALCFLVAMVRPFGWAWPLRRLLALSIVITTGVALAWMAWSGDLDVEAALMAGLPIALAALLGVPTLATR
jgi:fatty acid desaturase